MEQQEKEIAKIEALQRKHRDQLQANRQKVQERKARTRRLIRHGAIAESLIPGAEGMTDDEFADAIRGRL